MSGFRRQIPYCVGLKDPFPEITTRSATFAGCPSRVPGAGSVRPRGSGSHGHRRFPDPSPTETASALVAGLAGDTHGRIAAA